jgi:hypothetical protein
MSDADYCRVADCDRPGFVVVTADDEMLCVRHFNAGVDISYLNEPEGVDQ